MPDKIYMLLYKSQGNDTTDLFLPVRANEQPNYPNMPQFFGGKQKKRRE